jgi:hypothetical protein
LTKVKTKLEIYSFFAKTNTVVICVNTDLSKKNKIINLIERNSHRNNEPRFTTWHNIVGTSSGSHVECHGPASGKKQYIEL